MKTSFPNKPGKHQRMNMGMDVEQAAVGLHIEWRPLGWLGLRDCKTTHGPILWGRLNKHSNIKSFNPPPDAIRAVKIFS
jgi:hypothetical protein